MDGATATPDVSTQDQGPVAPPSWADSQPAQQAPQTAQTAAPEQAPQPSAMPPMGEPQIPKQAQQPQQPTVVTVTPQRRGGILGVVDSVMDALTGTQRPELAKGSDGNTYVKETTLSRGQQWARLGAEALQGAAAGMGAGRGNNAGGAFAAGVNKGVDIGNQRAQAPQKLNEEAQQANLEKANMQMVTMRNAQLAWTLKHEQVQASQEAVKFAEDQAQWMKDHGARFIGHMGDHGDLNEVLKNDPYAPKSLVNESAIKTVPTYDKDLNSAGIDVYKVDPQWNDEMQPAGAAFNVFDTTIGKEVVKHTTSPATNGQIYTWNTQSHNAYMDFVKKQTDIEKEQAETQAAKDKSVNAPLEANLTRAKTGEAVANTNKANAEADKARATNPGTAANQSLIDDIGKGQVAVDRMGILLSKNPDLLNAVTAKYPDFDTSKVGAYVATAKDFTSGKTSVQMNSGATALLHLEKLQQLNTTASHIPGTAAYNAYQNQLTTLAPELAKFYGDTTVPAIAALKATLGSQMPGTRDAAIRTQAQSMGAKFDNFEQTWKNAAPSAVYESKMPQISDAAKEARAKLDPAYRARAVQEMQPKAPPTPASPQTHIFDPAAWKARNPQGDVNAAIAQAKQQGYQVKQ